MDYNKIKNDKVQEANDLYKMLGIETNDIDLYDLDYFPLRTEFKEQSEQEKSFEFHWTRLSINSNINCIAE